MLHLRAGEGTLFQYMYTWLPVVYCLQLMDFYFICFQGPLFQQRPYPSPGAVLRRNAELAGQQGKPAGPNYALIHKRGDGSDGLGDAD